MTTEGKNAPEAAPENQTAASDSQNSVTENSKSSITDAGAAEAGSAAAGELFAKLLAERKIEIPHEVFVERLSIGDRISTITDRLRAAARIAFTSLFSDLREMDRHRVVPTFLAVLEMAKLKLIRVHQADPLGEIYLSRTEALLSGSAEGVAVDYRG